MRQRKVFDLRAMLLGELMLTNFKNSLKLHTVTHLPAMIPKVSLIHTKLEDLPESHQKLIREANEAEVIENERKAVESALQAKNAPSIEAKARADFRGRLKRVVKNLKIPKRELMRAIESLEIDDETTWPEIETLTIQVVLWIHTQRLKKHSRTKAPIAFSANPHVRFQELELAKGEDRALFEECLRETARQFGYPDGNFKAVQKFIFSRIHQESPMQK